MEDISIGKSLLFEAHFSSSSLSFHDFPRFFDVPERIKETAKDTKDARSLERRDRPGFFVGMKEGRNNMKTQF